MERSKHDKMKSSRSGAFACGGMIKKYADGGSVTADPDQPLVDSWKRFQSEEPRRGLPVVVRKNGRLDNNDTARVSGNNLIEKINQDLDDKYPSTPRESARSRAKKGN